MEIAVSGSVRTKTLQCFESSFDLFNKRFGEVVGSWYFGIEEVIGEKNEVSFNILLTWLENEFSIRQHIRAVVFL